MTSEITETSYYTVEFQSNFGADVWMFAVDANRSQELTEDEARKAVQQIQDLGFGVRVHLHEKRVSKQLVMETAAA